MDPAYALLRPLLFQLEAESAHRFTLGLAARVKKEGLTGAWARRYAPRPGPELAVQALGHTFCHPLGLAAGLDKDGEAIGAWESFGFAFMELGTVTPGEGQPGNEPPRVQRLVRDRAIVNRLGFPNRGAQHLVDRLAEGPPSVPVGINIGKAKLTPQERAEDDYRSTFNTVCSSADYIAVNVSSPNTPGLRDLQSIASLRPLLQAVLEENRALAAPKPLLVKIAPDLADDDVDAVADLALELGLDGVIATNTTIARSGLVSAETLAGGLSGAPLEARALEVTKRLYRRLEGRVVVVGVGGVMGAESAWRRIRAGASLLQVYTGFVYAGPGLIRQIVSGLGKRLESEGIRSITHIVGSDAA